MVVIVDEVEVELVALEDEMLVEMAVGTVVGTVDELVEIDHK